MEQPVLTTKRLLLRKYRLEDSDEIQRLAGNYNVSKMTLNVPHPYEDGMAEAWITDHLEKMNNGTQVTYAISDSKTPHLLGTISLSKIQDSQANLGYWIGEQYWGKGYCSEAAIELVAYGFNSLGLKRIYAQHLTCNPASGKVMINAGMQHINSTLEKGRTGQPESVEWYEILSS